MHETINTAPRRASEYFSVPHCLAKLFCLNMATAARCNDIMHLLRGGVLPVQLRSLWHYQPIDPYVLFILFQRGCSLSWISEYHITDPHPLVCQPPMIWSCTGLCVTLYPVTCSALFCRGIMCSTRGLCKKPDLYTFKGPFLKGKNFSWALLQVQDCVLQLWGLCVRADNRAYMRARVTARLVCVCSGCGRVKYFARPVVLLWLCVCVCVCGRRGERELESEQL